MENRELTTKEKILQESMKLFSVKGFEAVSVRAIAAEVGVRDSALYKHFKSKQAIFDAIVEQSKEKFYKQYKEMQIAKQSEKGFAEMCLAMFHFQTQDPWIVMFRQMLIIEQFKNPQIAEIYKEIFIDMPIRNQTELFKYLIAEGILKDRDPKVMAIELYAPFFLYHTVKEDEKELEDIFKQHALNFMESYFEKA